MKRSVAILVLALGGGLAACDGPTSSDNGAANAAPSAKVANAADAVPAADEASPAPASAPVADASAEAGVIDGAPAFAALYPGAQADGAPVRASSAAGPGGLITFTTDATPDAVVAFYRQRAEAAGLAPIMAMNQGDARAYGAAGRGDKGASLQVVASPGENGLTSVQLSWSAGA